MHRAGEGEEGGEQSLRARHPASLPAPAPAVPYPCVGGQRNSWRVGIAARYRRRVPEFKLNPAYTPTADQPQAIAGLAEGLEAGERFQTLLGATGTGKTFTMAATIAAVQRPALVIAHNKTLAAQLCNEFREFFPDNAVEYFVSYYDYYQPEAYVPAQDLYIEKDSSINDEIDRLRHAATAALFARRDVIIVASVSCIYGIGSPAGLQRKNAAVQGRRRDRPRRGAAQAGEDAVPAQRPGARARHLPGPRRGAGDHARLRRVRLPDLPLRRRDRGDPALRPADRRGARRDRPRLGLAGLPLRDQGRDGRARGRGDPGRTRIPHRRARGGRQAAGGPPAAPAHRLRPRDDQGGRLHLGDRELLADPRRPPRRQPAAHADRLLPRRLRHLRRRVPPDDPADRRHVRGRPLAQADADRLRLPPALGDRQPAAQVRRVPRAGRPAW